MQIDAKNIISNNEVILTDIQYFGTINWFKLLFNYSNIQFEQYETYQKMSFRNRCIIAGSNGLINLSVPLAKGRGQKELTKDVRISYSEKWQEQHWRSIRSCYGNSPFFEFYEEGVKQLFNIQPVFLFDYNLQIFDWVKARLKYSGKLSVSENYLAHTIPSTVDARNSMLPKSYDQQDLNVVYHQVFEDKIGFKPNLSILDLLFCNGPSSKAILMAE